MGRFLLIALVVAVLVWALRRSPAGTQPGAPPGPGGERVGDLVACAHCGVNLPKSEARAAGGRHYCSEEHRRLGPRDR
jgi:uncharacterized protein